MANQINYGANVTPPNASIEVTYNGGATWQPLVFATVGSLQQAVLANVPAANYASGQVGMGAVGYPATRIFNTTVVPVAAAAAAAAAAPTITSFSPASGLAGATITITGSAFAGATLVSINSGAVASFTVNSDTQITAVLTSSQASGTVRVTTPSGTGASTTAFTVTPPATAATIYQPTAAQTTDTGTRKAMTGYTYYDSYARRVFDWNATTCDVVLYSNWNAPTQPLSWLTMLVNGAFYQHIVPQTTGIQTITVSGLPTTASVIEIIDSGQRDGPLSYSCFIGVSTAGTAPAYRTFAAPVNRLVLIGDSRFANDTSAKPGVEGLTTRVRADFAAQGTATRVTIQGIGGTALYYNYGGAPAGDPIRASYVESFANYFDGTSKNTVLFNFERNDFGKANQTAAQFQAYLSDFATQFHNRYPAVVVQWLLPFPDTDGVGQANVPAFRTAILNVSNALGTSVLSLLDGATMVSASDYQQDGIHLSANQTGPGDKLAVALGSAGGAGALPANAYAAGSTINCADTGLKITTVPTPWSYVSVPQAASGQIYYSTAANAAYTLYIQSTTITLFYHLDGGGGVNQISCDGVVIGTFNTKASGSAAVAGGSATFALPGTGTHKIDVTRAGTAPSPAYVWFDRATC